MMAACGVALVGVLAFVRREAAFYAAFAPLLVGSLIFSRFDLGRRCCSSPRSRRCSRAATASAGRSWEPLSRRSSGRS